MIFWEITYMENEVKCSHTYFNKVDAIVKYINILKCTNGVSELKMFRNTKDYTATLNKFLFNN